MCTSIKSETFAAYFRDTKAGVSICVVAQGVVCDDPAHNLHVEADLGNCSWLVCEPWQTKKLLPRRAVLEARAGALFGTPPPPPPEFRTSTWVASAGAVVDGEEWAERCARAHAVQS